MSKMEDNYIESLHKKFTEILDGLLNTEAVEYENKEPILNDMKFMIDNRIRELRRD